MPELGLASPTVPEIVGELVVELVVNELGLWLFLGVDLDRFFVGPDGVIRSVVLAPLTEAGAAAQVEAILPGS